MEQEKLFNEAMKVAKSLDVSTPKDCVVLYSISFQPTRENKIKAFDFIKKNKGKMTLDHTDCGAKLVEMGMDSGNTGLSPEEVADIWAEASRRFIKEASGNIMAFVDNADERSVFRRVELPLILANPKIKTINGINKLQFKI